MQTNYIKSNNSKSNNIKYNKSNNSNNNCHRKRLRMLTRLQQLDH